jgi:hypothetical protein
VSERDAALEVAALIFETRLSVEVVVLGLTRIMQQRDAQKIAAELATLQKMTNQAADALECAAEIHCRCAD